ncbi:MAG: anthranilate synthase component I [Syntrophomonas sp.]|uniref:anthranilate synthase component I n=1 Tax=Syntrophomonas sp. TaxID=2053627 RepID=UPI0026398AEC|nr:anthranilate synthase component I [Syntrophomonas sp.]MDD2510091.1 anthranilate synthase component I [Syntrophomonas sp.]MDD4627070.1 anthranilate synthase component I [Syntrophomonas sp.]
MNNISQQLTGFRSLRYSSVGGVNIERRVRSIELKGATEPIIEDIDRQKGALFSSSYDYPGRYSQWDIGFLNPCLELRAWGKNFRIEPLKSSGLKLLYGLYVELRGLEELDALVLKHHKIEGSIKKSSEVYSEEERSRQPSIFSVIRVIREYLFYQDDCFLGLYGAFGYDLVYQFEPMELKRSRPEGQCDLLLYLPDELTVVDHRMARAYQLSYSFRGSGELINGPQHSRKNAEPEVSSSRQEQPAPGHYAALVEKAKASFRRGDLFEVVPSYSLLEPCPAPPSEIFKRLKRINPSPYGFIINLGDEHLVGASPEMYVRVEGKRVETCPISGTIIRGKDAIEDALQIRKLLNSSKDEAELTMCTDVDRNDKSRICEPGSVKVIGRRQIELYSHLIHTVDHVEGILRPDFDALDAFLTHMWAVTVTGAPKRAAIKWLEEHEGAPRGWYGGAVGYLSFNGDLNTGLTLRTIRIKHKLAEIRVGATLLMDSIPEQEEAETLVKAAAMLKAIQGASSDRPSVVPDLRVRKQPPRVLLVDHEDSFVHTLGNYLKQLGAEVWVTRAPLARERLRQGLDFDLLFLSPGPGRPDDFRLKETIDLAMQRAIPVFGVCLGMQGVVEYFGGRVDELSYPCHGQTSMLTVIQPSLLWEALPRQFQVGRYHSLYAAVLPDCLQVSAMSEDGVVMAVEHRELPVAAVQFHPESILTGVNGNGLQLLRNVVDYLALPQKQAAAGRAFSVDGEELKGKLSSIAP